MPVDVRLFSTLDRTTTTEGTKDQRGEDDDDIEGGGLDAISSNRIGTPMPYSSLTVGVMRECYRGENRVSLTPINVKMLVDAGMQVVVESGGEYVRNIYMQGWGGFRFFSSSS